MRRPQHHVSGIIIYRHYETRQLGTGADAFFAHCLPPACPATTPKTIGSQPPMRPQPESGAETQSNESKTKRAEQVETAIVHFDHGSARLDRHAKHTLALFSAIAKQSQRIIISGRTDNTGGDAVNLLLANARASAVAAYLREQSVAIAGRIQVDARGRCCYVARNELDAERQLNRRAEVSFYQDGKEAQ